MEEPTPERNLVPDATAHLSALTLERLAEGDLGGNEADAARVHLATCSRCTAELEAFGTLFTLLQGLPRYAPSPAFADAVMARVQIAPRESRLMVYLRRLLPTTRRGWLLLATILAAPATPFIAFAVWLLFQPLVSPATLWQWTQLRLEGAAQAAAGWVIEHINTTGREWLEVVQTTAQGVPDTALSGAIAVMAVAIPLSAWALVRLTRSPSQRVFHAN